MEVSESTVSRKNKSTKQHSVNALKFSKLEKKQRKAGVILVLPAMIHFIMFTTIPILIALWLSMTDYRVFSPAQWNWFANYVEMWNDKVFMISIWNTAVYTFWTVPVSMAISLVIAFILNQKLRMRAWYRAAFFLPHVTATVAIAMVWMWMYNNEFGLFNAFLESFGIKGINWLGDPNWSMFSVVLLGIWKGIGQKMIIYLAALQGIPNQLYEASKIDGANAFQQFMRITVPMLTAATFFIFVISLIDSFQVFEQIYVMTGGGPINSTTVMTYEIYQNAFESYRMGYASAQAFLLFVIVFILTIISRKYMKSEL